MVLTLVCGGEKRINYFVCLRSSPAASSRLNQPHVCTSVSVYLQAFLFLCLVKCFKDLLTSYVQNGYSKGLYFDRLCGLVVRVPGYTTEMYCASCEVRTGFIYVM
jgi:hypothetical protein